VERRIAASERKFRLLAENASDVVVHIREGRVVWVSPSVSELLGWRPEDWVGTSWRLFIHPDDIPDAARLDAVLKGHRLHTRLRMRSADGRYHWCDSHARICLDDEGSPDGWITALRVVDDLVQVEEELERRARVDALTGLLNRSEALRMVSALATRVPRTGNEVAVLFCDVDDFKGINDRFGHAGGDEVLRTLGERLRAAVRREDLVARIGGDELLVVLTGLHDLDEAMALAEKIRSSASRSIGLENGRISPTISIGVTLMRDAEATDSIIARADSAMYEAKEQGRDRVASA
jgi:diguanylate cyclase (GGDEF)-like protein/PAS domain S-box-containing protein